MAGTPQGMSRQVVLASLCLSLAIPVELHGTVVEVGAHDVEGAVSVDALHADQTPHLEHSAIEIRSRCAICVLTQKFGSLPLRPEVRHLRLQSTGMLLYLDAPDLDSNLNRCTPSRAPPLL